MISIKMMSKKNQQVWQNSGDNTSLILHSNVFDHKWDGTKDSQHGHSQEDIFLNCPEIFFLI